MLSSHWAYLMSGRFERSGSNWRIAEPPDQTDIVTFSTVFERFADTVLAAGKEIMFVRDIPDLDFDIATCFDSRPVRITPAKLRADCSIDQRIFEDRLSGTDAVLEDLLARYPVISVFNSRSIFCNGVRCQATNGELPYYANGDHLNHLGAALVVDDLMATLRSDDRR